MGSSEKKPLYVQLADRLRNRIMNEEYKYGQVFPPERELERIYGIDRKTVRKRKVCSFVFREKGHM